MSIFCDKPGVARPICIRNQSVVDVDECEIEAAGALIHDLWTQGRKLPQLPEHLRPRTRGEGYRIQACLERYSASRPFGWKIAATSAAGQRHIRVDGPLAGRILVERVLVSGGSCPLAGNLMRVAELEFAFRMAVDFAPRRRPYEIEEVLRGVDTLHPAIEVPDTRLERYEQVGAPQLIADNACADYFVLGPPSPACWRLLDLADHEVVARLSGGAPEYGRGSHVLGDPRVALTWLVNELSQHAALLHAGQIVTTGTCVKPIPIRPGDQLTGDFGRVGLVDLRFS